MLYEQRLALYKEYMQILTTDPLSLPMWLYLNYKFMMPATMIARTDAIEELTKPFKQYSICRI